MNESRLFFFHSKKIIDDALNIASASLLSYDKALDIVTYLQNETEYAPWKAAFRNFEIILSRFKTNEANIFEVNWVFVYVLELFSKIEMKSLIQKETFHLGIRAKSSERSLQASWISSTGK